MLRAIHAYRALPRGVVEVRDPKRLLANQGTRSKLHPITMRARSIIGVSYNIASVLAQT